MYQATSSHLEKKYASQLAIRTTSENKRNKIARSSVALNEEIFPYIPFFFFFSRLRVSDLLQSWQCNQRPERSAWEADFARGELLHAPLLSAGPARELTLPRIKVLVTAYRYALARAARGGWGRWWKVSCIKFSFWFGRGAPCRKRAATSPPLPYANLQRRD